MQASTFRPLLLLMTATLAAAPAPAVPAQGPTPPVADPIHMWLCDDASGTTLTETYNGKHGTLMGGMGGPESWSPDTPFPYPGNASLKFDGLDDHIVLAAQSLASGSTSYTISLWFWRYDDFLPKEYGIWGERDECDGDVFSVTVDKRPGAVPGFEFKDFFRPPPASPCGTGSWNEAFTPMTPSAGTWHHLAAVKDPVAGMLLYVDGMLVAGDAYTDAYIGYHSVTTLGDVGPAGVDGYWHGQLDEIALFTYSLSHDEILWLASHSVSELPPPPVTYCTAKVNSCGSTPAIWAAGPSRASASSGFAIAASNWRVNKLGILLYTDGGPAASPPPFLGGFLCLSSPVRRTSTVLSNSGGIGPCDGVIAIDMNAYASGAMGGNPKAFLSAPGTSIDCQWWGRDTFATGSLLSDAVTYVVGP